MDVGTMSELIGSIGFPIVACIYMAYLVKTMNDNHKEETEKMRETLASNTSAIEKLQDLIEKILSKLGE